MTTLSGILTSAIKKETFSISSKYLSYLS